MKPIIKVENASKNFKNHEIFKNISLTFSAGNCYGFIGYNGCGKSVFFKCICGFAKLTTGKIEIDGKTIGKEIDFIENAGVVIETPAFLNHLSGFKNLQILKNIRNQITDDDILNTMKTFDLYEARNKKVKNYSLGMKQKLRLAQAVMENPKILILDGPTNGLDKSSVSHLYSILKEFISKGGCLLISSHNKEDIDTLSTKVYEFDQLTLKEVN